MALGAAEIAELAFRGVIQGAAGAAAVAGAKNIWQKIKEKFQGNPIAEKALSDAEVQQSEEILKQQVVPLLQITMFQDTQFASEISNLAQQVKREINVNSGSQKNVTIGDVQASGNATAIGNLESTGNIGSIGGTHESKIVTGDEINQEGNFGIGVNKGRIKGNVTGEDRSKK